MVFVATNTLQKFRLFKLVLGSVLVLAFLPSSLMASSSIGINILRDSTSTNLEEWLDFAIRPLLTQREQEAFLAELEQTPPDWIMLQDKPGEERGHRLFEFNRLRDKQRSGHSLLQQRVAFYWSGILRKYVPELKGFRVAVGPVHTNTSWGLVRFKPVNLPSEMVAVPRSDEIVVALQKRLAEGLEITVSILFTGRLVQDESLMYAFSHETPHLGIILPFVHIERVHYILQ